MWTRETLIAVALWVQVATATPQLSCIARRESDFDVLALSSAGAVGVVQWMPETHAWMTSLFRARADMDHPVWGLLAGEIVLGNPVHDLILAAWAIEQGYGRHWATWNRCRGGR